MPDDVVKEVAMWLLRNFPAAILVGLLVHLRWRWSAWQSKLDHDVHRLKVTVKKLVTAHATRHKEDAVELMREEDEE